MAEVSNVYVVSYEWHVILLHPLLCLTPQLLATIKPKNLLPVLHRLQNFIFEKG